MKHRWLVALTVIALVASSTVAYAYFTRNQTINYALRPSSTMTIVNESLGSVYGGIQGTKYFTQAITVQTTLSGTRTLSLSLIVNASDWQSLSIGIGSCTLTLTAPSCTQSIAGPGTQIFDENVSYLPADGTSDINGVVSVAVGFG